jgi:hypothetical protein
VNSPALKEWGAAVQALLDGRQWVLLRKGGIGEKRFAVQAPEFVFFPTVAHSHLERVRPEHRALVGEAASDSTDDDLLIRGGAKVIAATAVNRPENLGDIADLHIWTDASVREDRLDFRPKHRLTVLVVQARPLHTPVRIPRLADYAGCRSWVDLPLTPQWGAPVHDDEALREIVARVRDSVG